MNTLRLIRWRGERHASITQRLNFAAHATPEATLTPWCMRTNPAWNPTRFAERVGLAAATPYRRAGATAGIILLMVVVSGLI